MVRGEGVYLWTSDGRRVLDLPASLWYCNVGHGRREIAEAAARQMSTLAAYSNFQEYATPPALQLAERLVQMAPVPEARVFFTSGGSDAVDLAGKLARRYWTAVGRPEKRTFVSRDRAYHGLHVLGTSIAGLQLNQFGYGPLVREVVQVPHNDWRALESLFIEKAEDIAAFFCEPIIGTGGVIHPAPDYLSNVQRLCREYDVLLVIDEVITGFGRAGAVFASHRFDIQPDILLFAKGVTSGYVPLGGAVIGGRVAEPFWRDGSELIFRHGLTYQGHATACSAALANLDIISDENLIGRVQTLEPILAALFEPLLDHPEVKEVRAGLGLLAGLVLDTPDRAAEVVARCWERGLITRQIGDGNILHVCPPFVVTEEQLAWAAEQVGAAISDTRERR